LIDEARDAGHYTEEWDGRDDSGRTVASGVYFYDLRAGAFKENRKMVLLR
jgi:flagellar hook assembly protein FlgD